MADDPFAPVAAVADAVLFEGYLLYPYRASARKNALRWQFGVLVPPACAAELAEPSRSRTECLVEPRPGATLRLRLRFLQPRARTVVDGHREVDTLDVGGTLHMAWDEAITRAVDAAFPLDSLAGGATVPVVLDPAEEHEPIPGARGARYVRRTAAIRARVEVTTTPVPGPYGALRLRVDVVNDAPTPPGTTREKALRASLVSAHTLLGLDGGAFLSTADPPEWAAPAVAACVQEHSWPVLAGSVEGPHRLVLASPIILEDHPQLAPESPTDLFDGTENDEILSLRTLTLTDGEKAEARATDPRAAALIDAVDAMGPAMFERLHGTIRPGGRVPDAVPTIVSPRSPGPSETAVQPWWDPAADGSVDPETDTALVDGEPVRRGSAVVLMPGTGTDAQDLFLRGMAATVQAVLHDVDGQTHVAVSLDDDPGADLQATHGRFRYFRPDELAVPS